MTQPLLISYAVRERRTIMEKTISDFQDRDLKSVRVAMHNYAPIDHDAIIRTIGSLATGDYANYKDNLEFYYSLKAEATWDDVDTIKVHLRKAGFTVHE